MRARIVLALGALLLSACRSAPPPNVVIVLVDTLRADHLGSYGHPGGFTPYLDGFAARGVRYAQAYASSTWTLPSVASLFTSRWPSQHGVVNLASVLPAAERTLAEILHERGWATAGFLATRSLPAAGGWAQGFEVWEETITPAQLKGSAQQVTERAWAWLDARARDDHRPVLLYLHYMEPHFPYDPLPELLQRVEAPRGLTADQRDARLGRFLTHALEEGGGRPEDMDVVRDYYLAEVASFDVGMRQLVEGLTARGILPNAVLVFTADHGEEFYEHGNVGHGLDLHNETLQVPLVVSGPGIAPAVVNEAVSLVDVGPSLLEQVGLPAEPRFDGRPLARALPARTAYAELLSTAAGKVPAQTHAVVGDLRKLIASPGGAEAFFDLRRDPGERDPNALDPAARTALRETLDGYRARTRGTAGSAERRELDEATRERLRALGYVK